MKIGIITLPLHTNYGGILQAYALQTVLQRAGHDVCVIEQEYDINIPFLRALYIYPIRMMRKMCGQKISVFYERRLKKELPILRQNTDKFIHRYINIRTYKSFYDIQENEFDAFVVGSDQVWRPFYFYKNNIQNAFLDFSKRWNVKRVAYAASFGTDKWEYTKSQTILCSRLLKSFDAVSVREDSAIKNCQYYFNIKANHVLDPTMLLDLEDYIKLIKENDTRLSKGTLLNYILDETPQKTKIVERIEMDKNLKSFKVNASDDVDFSVYERVQPPLEMWLRGFYDAQFVITDSFHACVFAILFRKPFIAIGNTNRGLSRFESLARTFNLLAYNEDNLRIYTNQEVLNDSLDILKIKKIESLNFLKTYLHE